MQSFFRYITRVRAAYIWLISVAFVTDLIKIPSLCQYKSYWNLNLKIWQFPFVWFPNITFFMLCRR